MNDTDGKATYEVNAVPLEYLISIEEEEEGFRPAKFCRHHDDTQWQIKGMIPSSD